MELVAQPYHALPCALEVFEINSISADLDDFGEGFDEGWSYAEDYACGNHIFRAFEEPPAGACERYNLSAEEWRQVADELEDVLRVGTCGWCV
jgi:hypothetical protein